MTLARTAFAIFDPGQANGLWFRLRHAFPDPLAMLRALRPRSAAAAPAHPDQRIVVVGLGWAALTCLKALKAAGFGNVTIIARDEAFGGKCVNVGCMPCEFALTLGAATLEATPVEARRERLGAFVASLRGEVEAQFQALGYRIVRGEARAVEGRRVVLADGDAVDFDRLILATGSDFPLPPQLALAQDAAVRAKLISVEDLWRLDPGARVAIYAEGNISALPLGEAALAMGLRPTVLLAGKDPLSALPSVRFYSRTLTSRGVDVRRDVRLARVEAEALDLECGRRRERLAYDHILVASRPIPTFFAIDGVKPALGDIDLTSGATLRRPDILYLGDGSGYFTAAEAERQARMIVRAWTQGRRPDLAALSRTPISLHGAMPLAMIGPPWTFADKAWTEVDFRALGWSKAHAVEGKAWYHLDAAGGRIDGLHICHPHAADLIAIAGLLIETPVTDPAWEVATVHPSSAEIFPVIAEHARASLGGGETWPGVIAARGAFAAPVPAPSPAASEPVVCAAFQLPELASLTPAGPLPDWLTAGDAALALTSSRPRRHLADCYAMAMLAETSGQDLRYGLALSAQGDLALVSPPDVRLDHGPEGCCHAISAGGSSVSVHY